MLNRPDLMDFKKYLPYLTNVKSLVGIGLMLFSFYTGCTDIPPKWTAYFDSIAAKNKLIEDKKSLSAEEKKLNRISQELDKNTTRLVLVPEGAAPDLTLIKIAQKVIDLCESTGNTYVSLQPGTNSSVDVNSLVTLPIKIPGTEATPGQEGTTPAPPAPSTASGAKIDWASGNLGLFPYTLTLIGSYPTLSKFIEEMSKQREFLILRNISIDPANTGGKAGAAEITMKLEFEVPWKPGKPPADQGQSEKPATEASTETVTDKAAAEANKPAETEPKPIGSAPSPKATAKDKPARKAG